MITIDVEHLEEDYYKWLANNNKFITLNNNNVELHTPIVDYFGESISVNITQEDKEKFLLTDFGETLWNLNIYGVDLSKSGTKRNELLSSLLQYEGLELSASGDIIKVTSKKLLSQAIHDFAHSLSNISNLAITRRDTIKSLFKDEVMNFFLNDKEKFPHVFPDFRVEGKSSLTHSYDLVFPGTETTYVKIIKDITLSSAKNILFDWEDVESFRVDKYGTKSNLNIIYSGEREINEDTLTMLNQYDVKHIDFTDRKNVTKIFSA